MYQLIKVFKRPVALVYPEKMAVELRQVSDEKYVLFVGEQPVVELFLADGKTWISLAASYRENYSPRVTLDTLLWFPVEKIGKWPEPREFWRLAMVVGQYRVDIDRSNTITRFLTRAPGVKVKYLLHYWRKLVPALDNAFWYREALNDASVAYVHRMLETISSPLAMALYTRLEEVTGRPHKMKLPAYRQYLVERMKNQK